MIFSSLEWGTTTRRCSTLFLIFLFLSPFFNQQEAAVAASKNSQKLTNYCFFHHTRSITDCSICNKHKLNEFQKLFFCVAQNQFSTSMDAIFTHLISNFSTFHDWRSNLMQSTFHLEYEKLVHAFLITSFLSKTTAFHSKSDFQSIWWF